jgi:pimeloyl-ACP methyl ester carboxylesterase
VTQATAQPKAYPYTPDPLLSNPDTGLELNRGGGRPLYFGHRQAPLFGWLHLPESLDPAPALGLVICNPFGNEAICSNRSLRHLAERAAHAGVPVLRFDYSGTGDSAGHDFDPDRVSAWVESIQAAADELRERTGVPGVGFLGIRLGATLAARAAANRTDVATLIAIAPIVNGKAYVRELRMLQRASEAKSNSASTQQSHDVIQAAGFALAPATQTALSGIDLTRVAPPAPRVLILDRAELPGAERWELHLRNAGAGVERLSVKGYTEMMLDSHETVVPEEILGEALKYLETLKAEHVSEVREDNRAQRAPGHGLHQIEALRVTLPPQTTPDPLLGEQSGTCALEETAVWFGSPHPLFGVVTSLVAAPRPAGEVKSRGIVLINSGAVHHVGPNRLYVALARHLAQQGHVVLRMDISGIGDSPTAPGAVENTVYSRHAVNDVSAAIKYLREHWHVQDVRAAGLCSGAYHAFKAAVARVPVNGIVLINPLTFFWKEGMSLQYPEYRVAADIMRYRTNVLRPTSWLKVLRGQVNLWESSQVLLRRVLSLVLKPLRALARSFRMPLADDLPSELERVVRAGIELRFVFAANEPGVELLRTQGGATARKLVRRGLLRIETIDAADHTFTDSSRRATLISILERALCG